MPTQLDTSLLSAEDSYQELLKSIDKVEQTCKQVSDNDKCAVYESNRKFVNKPNADRLNFVAHDVLYNKFTIFVRRYLGYINQFLIPPLYANLKTDQTEINNKLDKIPKLQGDINTCVSNLTKVLKPLKLELTANYDAPSLSNISQTMEKAKSSLNEYNQSSNNILNGLKYLTAILTNTEKECKTLSSAVKKLVESKKDNPHLLYKKIEDLGKDAITWNEKYTAAAVLDVGRDEIIGIIDSVLVDFIGKAKSNDPRHEFHEFDLSKLVIPKDIHLIKFSDYKRFCNEDMGLAWGKSKTY